MKRTGRGSGRHTTSLLLSCQQSMQHPPDVHNCVHPPFQLLFVAIKLKAPFGPGCHSVCQRSGPAAGYRSHRNLPGLPRSSSCQSGCSLPHQVHHPCLKVVTAGITGPMPFPMDPLRAPRPATIQELNCVGQFDFARPFPVFSHFALKPPPREWRDTSGYTFQNHAAASGGQGGIASPPLASSVLAVAGPGMHTLLLLGPEAAQSRWQQRGGMRCRHLEFGGRGGGGGRGRDPEFSDGGDRDRDPKFGGGGGMGSDPEFGGGGGIGSDPEFNGGGGGGGMDTDPEFSGMGGGGNGVPDSEPGGIADLVGSWDSEVDGGCSSAADPEVHGGGGCTSSMSTSTRKRKVNSQPNSN
ncbi:hypothetical protein DFH07DRAFT_771343 [Mycena maculata]|uniref:Uncharacterized protein n=1 Tax=Mycena maculata TaxID=230809 RepID=A0AAD7NH57_9AGAR|nr:hypothetical protein DFH07DRAFT_771343 [Mycena maculata]